MSILDVAYDALFNKWRKTKQQINNVVNTYNKIMASPEVQYIKDTWQFQKAAQVNADNHIWPAFNNVVSMYNTLNSPNISATQKGYIRRPEMDKAVDEYNKALKEYWQYTTWWPSNSKWEYHIQDKFGADRYGASWAYSYTNKWKKANAIWSWQEYRPQEFKFQTQSWADLIRQMNYLSGRYNELDALEKTVWPQWNALREQWKWDTKEARGYLDQWFVYDKEKMEIYRALRRARDDYYNLVQNYNNGTL